ncbi:hypothetical protein ACFWPU_37085 [Streptomyces sp. NPDC058471]|uniref:hypothetical protein n=1 Tax=Streptomyces sp. NPDC058471 TaxID=3346516 RepID=UPI00365A21AD
MQDLSQTREGLLGIAAQLPQLAACYLLLAESTRLASSHVNIGKRYVFDLRRARDAQGLPDEPVMSGKVDSTGIRESFLDELKRGRRNHRLTAFERTPRPALAAQLGVPPAPLWRRSSSWPLQTPFTVENPSLELR